MKPSNPRSFIGSYAVYTLFHLVLSPFLGARGWLRAKRRWYDRILWQRLMGGTPPPHAGPWLVLVAGGLGESRPALRVAEEAARRGVHACVLVQRQEALGVSKDVFIGALPFNNPLSVAWFLRRYSPSAIAAVEYIENHHLSALASLKGVPCCVFNALVPAPLAERTEAWRFQAVSQWLTQGESDAERLRLRGVSADRARSFGLVGVAPAATRDDERDELRAKWGAALGLGVGPVVVAGSTHPDDEAIVLDAFARLREVFPDAVLVMAPRDLNRRGGVEAVLREHGVPFVTRSSGQPVGSSGVFVLDTHGELGGIYSIAAIAHVGGSFDPIRGGHNPAEALAWGVPITMGPERSQQLVLTEALINAGVLEITADAGALAAAWTRWVADSDARARVRAISAEFVSGQERRVVELVDLLLSPGTA